MKEEIIILINRLQNRQIITGYFFAIGATALWSGNFIIARGLNESIPPISLAFWRWVVAIIAIFPFALKPLIVERHILKDHIPYLSITSLLGITIFNTLIYFASHTTTAINLSLISITFPIFIVILSRIIFGELITVNKSIGIIVVATGVLLLITKGALSNILNISFAIDDVWMLMAAIIFASLSAFVLWNKAIATVGPSKAGMIYYTLPLFSGILAHFFLKEDINRIHLYSVLLIVTGIVTANYESNKINPTLNSGMKSSDRQ